MLEDEKKWEIDNLPNRITLFRILLVPIIVTALTIILWDIGTASHKALGHIAGWTFVVAAITDFFDGYIARKKNIVTVFGSFLDPIADKFLVVSSLILLQGLGRIPTLIVMILVLREFYITSLRLLANNQGITIPVGKFGKFKATAQMIGIPMLMPGDSPWGIPMHGIGTLFIYIASFFSLYSAAEYSAKLITKIRNAKAFKKRQQT